MERKIKILYMLSIVAIIAFLGMQCYWLYGRYEFSLREYEDVTGERITDALKEYDEIRAHTSTVTKEATKIQSVFNMNTDVDSVGNRKRTVTVTTRELDGKKLLGITEKRKLTPEEMDRLQKLVIDSLDMVDAKVATIDATTAPSDGLAWNAMRNFESEIQSPFTVTGIDSLLRKHGLNAEISLIVMDSVTWQPVTVPHSSVLSPCIKVIAPYSELERKAVAIRCKIPTSDVLRSMGWTLILALVLSILLILCLVWQIKTIAKLSRLDKMRSEFIITMIHELKRPISTLKMCVSGIDNDKLMEDDQLRRELTGEIRMALDNLSAYFSKLRDITFNNVEQIPLNIVSFDLSQLVDDVTKSIQLPSDKIAVLENLIPVGVDVSADRTHLINILTNLIENAIKYSGESVIVKISARRFSRGIFIMVEDNGNGIAASDHEKIFGRFYRGKTSSTDIPGMGLGLAYVRLLSRAHGGDIVVNSEEGVGSFFTIVLPQ